jgi:hypothetical protein
LNRQDLGQEILFEEINDLKKHFNLGKKNWFDLFVGRVSRVSADKIIQDTVATEIINALKSIATDFQRLLN